MPTYCYRREGDGELVECVMSVAEMERRQRVDGSICLDDGGRAFRDMRAEHGQYTDTPGAWPLVSDAAGVHPSQVQEAIATAEGKGVPTDFMKDGRAIFRSRQHRKRFCEAHGLYDRNGGYSDPHQRR